MALQDSWVKKEFDASFSLEEERKASLLEAMGLTQHDVDALRKTMLSSDEAVCAKAEELQAIRQHKGRKADWEEFIDFNRRLGKAMPATEFIGKLRLAVPRLIVAPAAEPTKVGLYVTRNIPAEEVAGYRGSFRHVEVPLYIGWVDLKLLPEYEIDLVNEVGVAVRQIRGWRTILLRLHCRRSLCPACSGGEFPRTLGCGKGQCGKATSLVDQDTLLRVFGPPTNGATASHYRKRLYDFRNGLS